MIVSSYNQMLLLLAAVYGGFLLGLIFDIYRFIRKALNFGRIVTYIGDFLFCIISSITILIIVYKSSSGLLRVYQLVGFFLGMLMYLNLLSRYIMRLLYILVTCMKRFFYTVLKIVRGPFVILSRILWVPYNRLKNKTFVLFSKILQDTRKRISILKNKK